MKKSGKGAGSDRKENTGNCPKRHDKPVESYYNKYGGARISGPRTQVGPMTAKG